MNTELLAQLYQSSTGEAPTSIEPLPEQASNRKYFRLKGKESLIGVYGTSPKKIVHLSVCVRRHFLTKRFARTPYTCRSNRPVGGSTCKMTWEISHCSNLSNKARESGNFSDEETDLLKQTIRLLPQIPV